MTNPDYKLRDVAGEYLLIPVGKELKAFNGLGTLNETGLYIWKLLQNPIKYEDIINHLDKEYELCADVQKDIDEFLDKAISRNAIYIQ